MIGQNRDGKVGQLASGTDHAEVSCETESDEEPFALLKALRGQNFVNVVSRKRRRNPRSPLLRVFSEPRREKFST